MGSCGTGGGVAVCGFGRRAAVTVYFWIPLKCQIEHHLLLVQLKKKKKDILSDNVGTFCPHSTMCFQGSYKVLKF